MARRSIISDGSSVGRPWTCERKPSSAYDSDRVIPDFASYRLASTSWVLFPMDETIPIPVMTTRLMIASPSYFVVVSMRPDMSAGHFPKRSGFCLRSGSRLEQPHFQVLRAIDNVAVGGKP